MTKTNEYDALGIKGLVENGIMVVKRTGTVYELTFPPTMYYTRVYDPETADDKLLELSFDTIGSKYPPETLKYHLEEGQRLLPLFFWLSEKDDLYEGLRKTMMEPFKLTHKVFSRLDKIVPWTEPKSCRLEDVLIASNRRQVPIYAFIGAEFILCKDGQVARRVSMIQNVLTVDGKKYELSSQLADKEQSLIDQFFDNFESLMENAEAY